MNIVLRVILICASVLVTIWILHRIRKAKVKMEDAIFWILFSVALLLMAIFPGIPAFFSNLVGIESPSNFVFVAVICLLLIKIFTLSVRISQLEEKITVLSAEIAIRSHDMKTQLDEKNKENKENKEN